MVKKVRINLGTKKKPNVVETDIISKYNMPVFIGVLDRELVIALWGRYIPLVYIDTVDEKSREITDRIILDKKQAWKAILELSKFFKFNQGEAGK